MSIDDVTFIENFLKIHGCHETVRNSSFGSKSYAESTPKSFLDIEPRSTDTRSPKQCLEHEIHKSIDKVLHLDSEF